MICPNCGNDINENAAFCNNCGTQVNVRPAQVPLADSEPAPTVKKFPVWLMILLIVLVVAVIGIGTAIGVKLLVGNKKDDGKSDDKDSTSVSEKVSGELEEEPGTTENITENIYATGAFDSITTSPRLEILYTKNPIDEQTTNASGDISIVHTKPSVTKVPQTAGTTSTTKPSTTKPATTAKPSTTKPATTAKPSTTRPSTTVQPSVPVTPPSGGSYLGAYQGYDIAELEDAMTDYVYSNNWRDFSEYRLPGSDDIVYDAVMLEDEQGYESAIYIFGYESVTEFYESYGEIPYIEEVFFEYHDLDDVDEDYRDNISYGLYDMVETVFDEYYGGNMEFVDLAVMEIYAVGDDGEDYGFFVFIIETDYGCFFLCR